MEQFTAFASPSAVAPKAPLTAPLTATSTTRRGHCRSFDARSPWIARHYPSSAAEEASFVGGLKSCSTDTKTYARHDVVVLLTGLRCGLHLHDLLDQAPGVKPAALLTAYQALEARRQNAVAAWEAISKEPTCATFALHAKEAFQLLPEVISKLASAYCQTSQCQTSQCQTSQCQTSQGQKWHRQNTCAMPMAVDAAVTQIAHTTAVAMRVEQDIASASFDRARELGQTLLDVSNNGLWASFTFLAPRVGALDPARAATLTAELASNHRKPR